MNYVVSSDIHGNTYNVALDELKWRPAAYGIIVHDEQILLTKQHNAYHLPGGGVEPGEMPDQTVIREVKEETGITVANPRLVSHISGFFSYDTDTEPEHFQSILLYFVCDYAGGELSTDGFTDYEKTIGAMPEWIPLKVIDTIKAGSTIQWRDMVKEVLELN